MRQLLIQPHFRSYVLYVYNGSLYSMKFYQPFTTDCIKQLTITDEPLLQYLLKPGTPKLHTIMFDSLSQGLLHKLYTYICILCGMYQNNLACMALILSINFVYGFNISYLLLLHKLYMYICILCGMYQNKNDTQPGFNISYLLLLQYCYVAFSQLDSCSLLLSISRQQNKHE